MSRNRIANMGEEVRKLTGLDKLIATHNILTAIPDLSPLVTLTHVDFT